MQFFYIQFLHKRGGNCKHKLFPMICERSFGDPSSRCSRCRGTFVNCALLENRRSKIANRDTPWCNGNTAPFGGVILGSNPSGVAAYKAFDLTRPYVIASHPKRSVCASNSASH